MPPEQPLVPVTTNSGQNIVVSWTAPVDNGAIISSYQILLRQGDLTFVEELNDCDGNDATITSSTECTIPISTFTSAPFSLNFADSVVAKVYAINVKGPSLESAEGNGANIITRPDKPINL